MKLLLFDIDGTLIHPGGAAVKAVNRAFKIIYGIENAMDGIRPDGKTDPAILREMFYRSLNRDFSPKEADELIRVYVGLLRDELVNSTRFFVLHGVHQILNFLSKRYDMRLGIATGNIEEGAWIKLRHSGLDSFFKFGAYGSDSEHREKIVRIAMERGILQCNDGEKYDEVFVIGDTPYDIIHGRAAGAKAMAVATGSYSLRELEAYDPDYLIENLKDFGSVLNIFVS